MKNVLLLFSVFCGFRLAAQGQAAQVRGDFALKNVHTGKYVRIKDANGADGTPIVAYSPENWKCVTWQFAPSANGSYTLKNLLSGKTLQPLKGETKPGVSLEERPFDASKPQEYELVTVDKDKYRIRLKGTDLFITPSDPGGGTNTAIILQPQQAGDLQEWVLIEQHPTM
jgi:Ricin-type beta-trefoil lectin domain-like